MGYVLAIDYGTSYTAAAMRVGDGPIEVLEIEGERRLASQVFRGDDGTLLTGLAAENSAARAPQRLERSPKAWLGQTNLLLDGEPVKVADAVAAVLSVVLAEARRRNDGADPDDVRLTHPAAWGTARRQALVAAAKQAGIRDPALISEPEAAARFFADSGGRTARAVAVYDLGGGTFDAAVLMREANGAYHLAGAPAGDETIGGEDFDRRLYTFVAERIIASDPEAWHRFACSDARPDRVARRKLMTDVRGTKETLSTTTSAHVYIGPLDRDVTIRRSDLEALISADISRTLGLLSDTITASDVSEEPTVYLTGGSSRIPLVAAQVGEAFADVRTQEDPKTIVARGAAAAEPPAVDVESDDGEDEGEGEDATVTFEADEDQKVEDGDGAGAGAGTRELSPSRPPLLSHLAALAGGGLVLLSEAIIDLPVLIPAVICGLWIVVVAALRLSRHATAPGLILLPAAAAAGAVAMGYQVFDPDSVYMWLSLVGAGLALVGGADDARQWLRRAHGTPARLPVAIVAGGAAVTAVSFLLIEFAPFGPPLTRIFQNGVAELTPIAVGVALLAALAACLRPEHRVVLAACLAASATIGGPGLILLHGNAFGGFDFRNKASVLITTFGGVTLIAGVALAWSGPLRRRADAPG